MSILYADKISKVYGVTPVLTDVSFRVEPKDRIGIVGANGAGKTTLINILAGELSPDGGTLHKASDLSVGYLKQRDHFCPDRTVEEEMMGIFEWQLETEKQLPALAEHIAALSAQGRDVAEELARYDALVLEFENRRGYEFRSQIRGVLASLAFTEDDLSKQIDCLSGGERTRLALASLLLKEPDLLLLDEPTNHLDIGTLRWLEQYLAAYNGTIIVISHDRYFLDRTVGRIFEIEHQTLTVYEGNYSSYADKKQLRLEEELKRYEQAQQDIRREEDIIRRLRQHQTEKLAKRARSREKRLAHAELPDRPASAGGRLNIRFHEKLTPGNDILSAQGLSMSFGDGRERRTLFRGVNLEMKRGDRLCLVGENGIGKTTLLKILLGRLTPDEGTVRLGQNVIPAYYDQEQQMLQPENTVLEEVHASYRLYDQQELRTMLGRFLFRGDDVFKKVRDLAGGEKARLSLLKLMLSGANFLVMDEPTNHLDIGAKEVFEQALIAYPGTLLIASHDRYLLSKIPTAICELSAGGIETYLGGYDYYAEKSRRLASGKTYLDRMAMSTGPDDREPERQKELDKEARTRARREEREQAALDRKIQSDRLRKEAEITEAEALIARIEAELCREEVYSDPQAALEWSGKLQKAQEEMERLYEQWMALP
ncbi:MAG TPA: ABC-F family ATP-binding cassette domain-containing protein [Clostridiales bacterium]|jgi:ATP-binding cassette subfamily F protein 3|nr:ABC-F family ATP-binding cassette domain-containing protein [Clostridiales bacterium]